MNRGDVSEIQPYSSQKQVSAVWKLEPLMLLVLGSFLLHVGNKIYEIVLPLMMYDMTHSSVAMASMRTAELLPNLLFGVIIGVIVDRVNTKRWVLWMVSLQAIILIILAALFKTGNGSLWPYYLGGFLLMTFGYGYFNAQISLTKQTARPDQLTSANAKFSFAETLVSVLGPVLSACILMFGDKSDGLVITALLFGFSFIIFSRVAVPGTDRQFSHPQSKGSLWRDLKEGWEVFRSNPILRTVTMFVLFLNCTTVVFQTTIIYYAKDVLNISSYMLAVFFSISGVGGLLGSFWVQKIRKRLGLGKTIGLTAMVNASVYLGVYLLPTTPVIAAALFVFGFSISVFSVCVYTLRHEQTPTAQMGRISGITGTFFRIGMPVTMYASGWMMLWWSPTVIFAALAFWNVAVFLFYVRSRLWRD
jgi:Na+/melibiose symporter-like transporter